jgi:glycine/D-amino acid oxidase-like deaminating enzyme/nitrite reductase/ring-hydroxylating ferredoxin subunit
MPTTSHWKSISLPGFPRLNRDVHVDVAVVGAGMTGISAAYLLKKAGRRVALIERDRCAQQDTANTTAHLTFVTDLRPAALVRSFGRDHAAAVWDAGLAAIQQIHSIIETEGIQCDWAWAPGYLHATIGGTTDERIELERDAALADELGFDVGFVGTVPIFGRPGVRFANQAMFHPLKYLAGVVACIPGGGCHVFEETDIQEFERAESAGVPHNDRILIRGAGHTISCDFVVIATDVPLMGLSNPASAAILQTKITPYTSYALGARLPRGRAPHACYWDTSDPYYFLRVSPGDEQDYAVFGGLDHKTGQVDETESRFGELERTLRGFLSDAAIDSRWSGQVIESQDGLPLIGETAPGQFVATGYSGNGLTFGTLAAMMACDVVNGRKNPWSDLFSPQRTTLRAGAWNYLRENADYPYYMLKDRLARGEGESPENVLPGTGRILKIDGRRVAAYRDHDGRLTVLSPVCTHLGCIVHWNEAESTWDCPCHGSRFRCTGEVLAGPAEKPLEVRF